MDFRALKDQACAQVYVSRMLKLQQKLSELGLFRGPNALMEEFVPQQFIDVGWGEKDTENVALFGNVLPLSRTWEKPNVIFETSASSSTAGGAGPTSSSTTTTSGDDVFYTVVIFDADHDSGAPYVLCARLNICGDVNFSSGRDLIRWQPPHPSANSGAHRIFVVVFHQSEGAAPPFDGAQIISKSSRSGRDHFRLQDFCKAHKLGHVIGANAWRVQHDPEVVPRIVKELRDRVVLDPTGKRVLLEELDGKVVYTASSEKKETVSSTVPQ